MSSLVILESKLKLCKERLDSLSSQTSDDPRIISATAAAVTRTNKKVKEIQDQMAASKAAARARNEKKLPVLMAQARTLRQKAKLYIDKADSLELQIAEIEKSRTLP